MPTSNSLSYEGAIRNAIGVQLKYNGYIDVTIDVDASLTRFKGLCLRDQLWFVFFFFFLALFMFEFLKVDVFLQELRKVNQ